MSFGVGEVVHTSEADPAEGARIAGARRSYIGQDNWDEVSASLAPLRPHFAPWGVYEHHGCRLASVPHTRSNVHRIADLLNVPVTIPFGVQFAPTVADPTPMFRFSGQTYTAYPGGASAQAWARRIADLTRREGLVSGLATPDVQRRPSAPSAPAARR